MSGNDEHNNEKIPHFEIDFEKVKTLDDVIKILKALNITFAGMYPETLKEYIKVVDI